MKLNCLLGSKLFNSQKQTCNKREIASIAGVDDSVFRRKAREHRGATGGLEPLTEGEEIPKELSKSPEEFFERGGATPEETAKILGKPEAGEEEAPEMKEAA